VWTIGLGNSTFQIPGDRTPGAEATQGSGPTTIAAGTPPARKAQDGPGGVKDVQPKYSIIRGEIFIKEPRQLVPQTWVIKPGIKPQKIQAKNTSQNPM
jgi:hypothetical protein